MKTLLNDESEGNKYFSFHFFVNRNILYRFTNAEARFCLCCPELTSVHYTDEVIGNKNQHGNI